MAMETNKNWRSPRSSATTTMAMWFLFIVSPSLASAEPSPAIRGGADNSDVLKELGVDIQNDVPQSRVSAVQGSSVDLPCNTAPIAGDRVKLVLWFKNNSSLPVYTYDVRGKAHTDARHWSDDKTLAGRAFFRGDQRPARLVLDNIRDTDRAVYKCRVDYDRAPTKIFNVALDIIVPPEKPRIFSDRGKEVRLKLGPYEIGDDVRLRCEAYGGRPLAKVTWWRDHALLDDSFQVERNKVSNELVVMDLKRSDLHTIFTCQAANNNISVPVSTSVKLDMQFGPVDVRILNAREPLSTGHRYDVRCRSIGARPHPKVTWWIGGQEIRDGIGYKSSPDGNVTLSTLSFVPSVRDAAARLVCRSGVMGLPESTLEDTWKLEVHYVPSATLLLGSSLNASNIKEGDDVYFECGVKSNPRPYKITWKHNGRELSHDVAKKVIISNQSLVLQKVTRSDSGVYTCTAHNAEGDGESNHFNLDIRYKPFCKPDQIEIYGVAKRERTRVTCDVIANPSGDLKFSWVFNSSSERVDLQENLIEVRGTTSLAHHTPQTEMDYGTLMCWATNSIGRMERPCVFHVIPAGKPDPVHNCTVRNQTYSTLHVTCGSGFDGGLQQGFIMAVKDAQTHFVVANTTNTRRAAFTVTGLRPGTGYIVSVHSYNPKGSSEEMVIHAFTAREGASGEQLNDGAAKPKTGESALTKMGEFTVTPILAVLIIVGAALVLVILVMSAYLCFRRKPVRPKGSRRRNNANGGGSMSRMSYTGETHIPLQKGIDDCVTGEITTLTGAVSSPTGINNGVTTLPRLIESSNPDLIPVQARDVVEEDGGFGAGFGERTRCATLQRQRMQHQNNQEHHYPRPQQQAHNGDRFMTLGVGGGSHQNFRAMHSDYDSLSRIKNNITSLSQEVTYAELTLPRKQGYTILRRVSPSSATSPPSSGLFSQPPPSSSSVFSGPLSTSSSSSAGPSVIYARIEKPQQPLSLLVAPPGLGSAPGTGGGVSPSSFMNTSCDSSTSSATTTRCRSDSPASAAIHAASEMLPRGGGSRQSSDEGFTSGGSPVGNLPQSNSTAPLLVSTAHAQAKRLSLSSSSSSELGGEELAKVPPPIAPRPNRPTLITAMKPSPSPANHQGLLTRESTV